MREIAEYQNVTPDAFRAEILPRREPALLRGAVADWPAVKAGAEAALAACDYLKAFDRGQRIEVFVGPPSIGGRLFYQDNMGGMNFVRHPATISAALDRMLSQLGAPEAEMLYIQSAPVAEYLSGFERANAMPFVPPSVAPRIWIGTPVTVAPHFDLAENIACCVAGRRRITLFPPEQLPNLYVGPVDFSPAGTPISMVSLDAPDLQRYPRFSEALAVAQQGEIGPGDAVYIPYFWWHSVTSLEPFNALVNYWWNDARPWVNSPYDSLLHAVLALRDLPDEQRAAWRGMFDYFVFKTAGEPLAHLEPQHRGALGPLTPERARHLRLMLARALGAG